MSDQSYFPSFQVHMTPATNGTFVAIPLNIPYDWSRYISVVSATVPNSVYNFVGQKFVFSNPSVEFIVPDGFYSIGDLCNMCKWSSIAVGFCLEYDPLTGKVTMVLNGGLTLGSTPLSQSLGLTGSLVPYVYPGVALTPQRTDRMCIKGTQVIDLSGLKNVFVKSNFFIQSETSNRVLAKIPIDVPFGGIVQYRNPNGFRGKIQGDDEIKVIRIELVDENDVTIDFNGLNWSVTLQIDYMKPDPVLDMFAVADPLLQPESGSRPELTLDDGENISA